MKDVDLLCLGQRVGRYRISSYLGAGGFGTEISSIVVDRV